MSSTRPIAQCSRAAGTSSRPTAPLPARAHSGIAARLSKPGLASHIDAHPEADGFNDPPGNIANDVPEPDTTMPDGWESNPNWGSDASVWALMRGPDDSPKPLSKKRKKQAHDYEHVDGWTAACEKATREYLMQSVTHTFVDEPLKSEIRMARCSFALQEAARAKAMVIPTPQFADLTVRPSYPGEGEPLPHGDPPIPVTGYLPCPLGRSVPRTAEWFKVCPIEDIRFKELHELMKITPPAERTREMNTTFQHVQAQTRRQPQTGPVWDRCWHRW
jgi:hypothetical protein